MSVKCAHVQLLGMCLGYGSLTCCLCVQGGGVEPVRGQPKGEEEEKEEVEEGLFKANAVNEEDPERDRAGGRVSWI